MELAGRTFVFHDTIIFPQKSGAVDIKGTESVLFTCNEQEYITLRIVYSDSHIVYEYDNQEPVTVAYENGEWADESYKTIRFDSDYGSGSTEYEDDFILWLYANSEEIVTKYSVIAFPSPSAGGTVTRDKNYAAAGETVTLTVTANPGYSFYKYDTNVPVTFDGNQFVMPKSAVTIYARFIADADYLVSNLDLSLVAEAIRRNLSTRSSISFPEGFINGIDAIQVQDIDDFICNYATMSTFSGHASRIGSCAFCYSPRLAEVAFPECQRIQNGAFSGCTSLITADFPICSTVHNGAFNHCTKLTSINIPECQLIMDTAFQSCYSLQSITCKSCSTVGTMAFMDCSSLSSARFNDCYRVGTSAFLRCSSLAYAYFAGNHSTNSTYIGASAFYDCIGLKTAYVPHISKIESNAFYNCIALSAVYASECEYIMSSAFKGCISLPSIDLPMCVNLGENAFNGCINLSSVSIPECEVLNDNAFRSCSNLSTISIPKCRIIGGNGFRDCVRLLSVYLLGSSFVSSVFVSAFYSTPIGGYTEYTSGVYGSIYVPASMLSDYVNHEAWSQYSSRFVGV